MKTGYRELVGLRVTFSKIVPQYHMTNYYRWSDADVLGPVLMMRGYDMQCVDRESVILESLLRAYAPAIKVVLKFEDDVCSSTYLSFHAGGMPVELALEGDWKRWAEW